MRKGYVVPELKLNRILYDAFMRGFLLGVVGTLIIVWVFI